MTSAPVPAVERPKFSIVVPVYGCEGCLKDLCDRLRETLGRMRTTFEIVLVCDASTDESWRRILEIASHDVSVRGLLLARNYGQHCAISAGLRHARGEWVVVMDCDLQDPPEAIETLYEKASEGYDLVFAQRVDRRDTFLKRFFSQSFYRVLGYLTDTKYDPSTANFGVFSARTIAAVNALPERDRFFPLMARWPGYPTTLVPIPHAERQIGCTSYSFKKMSRLAIEIILSYSDKPLRLVVKAGLVLSSISFLLVIVSLYRYLRNEIAVAGYTSIIASVLFFGGVTIFCIGIVGLYIGRMFNEIKKRPYYAISEDTKDINGHPPGPASRREAC